MKFYSVAFNGHILSNDQVCLPYTLKAMQLNWQAIIHLYEVRLCKLIVPENVLIRASCVQMWFFVYVFDICFSFFHLTHWHLNYHHKFIFSTASSFYCKCLFFLYILGYTLVYFYFSFAFLLLIPLLFLCFLLKHIYKCKIKSMNASHLDFLLPSLNGQWTPFEGVNFFTFA